MNLISFVKRGLLKIKMDNYYVVGRSLLKNQHYIDGQKRDKLERNKTPSRTVVINFILSLFKRETTYLEIGVRNPEDNFNKIKSDIKYSVDPGIAFQDNPVDFPITSDEFFKKLDERKIFPDGIKFDVIFIDGLHYAEQVDRDIKNSLRYLKNDGYIILHDCNPPTEWHTRLAHDFSFTPARYNWNGTTWKAFLKWRCNSSVHSCCVDSDYGVGIISKNQQIGKSNEKKNEFYEYSDMVANRVELLNLLNFNDFRTKLLDIHKEN